MMNWLVASALRQRVLVVALAVLLLFFGVHASRDVPLDVFPEFAPPMVEVQTEAPGLSTEEVEALVTTPLEFAVNGTPGLKTLRSKSVLGLSSVQLIFTEGTDVVRARQLVQERVTVAQARLPVNVRPPVMLPPLSATSRALKIGLTSQKLSHIQLSELVRWTIRPKLMGVPGVANVAVWGQRDRQLQVLVDPARLMNKTVATLNVGPFEAQAIGDYVGRRFATFTNDASVNSYFLISGRISARIPEGVLPLRKAELALNVTNITDKEGVSTLSIGSATNSYSAYPIPPRQWFLTLSAAY